MTKPIVLIDVRPPKNIEQLLEPLCTWELFDAVSDAAQVHGLYVYGHPIIDGPFLDQYPNLKIVSNFGVGIDHVDLKAAAERGVLVGNTPGAVDGATADTAMAILMATARNVVIGDRYARSKEFTHYDPSLLLGVEVHGNTLGICGMGRVGRELAKRARGFDMQVLYHNRTRRPEDEAELGVKYATREELLSTCQFVCLTLPLTPETAHYIAAPELELMRDDAILVNVARGGVVDHDALFNALTNGQIRSAAIDVTEPEPLPRDHPLLRLDNLVITPHLGSAANHTRQRMAEMAAQNLLAGLEGSPLSWPIGAS